MSGEMVSVISSLVTTALRMSIPVILASLAGVFSARAGIVAMGLEGMMLSGSFAAAYVTWLTGNPYLGILGGILAGVAMSVLHGILVIKFRLDQVIGGIGLNLFASGLPTVFLQMVWGNRGKSEMLNTIGYVQIPVLGKVSPLLLVAFTAVFSSVYVLYQTVFGLHLRMVGENPAAAKTLGIYVNRVRFQSLIIVGVLSGLAGAYLSIDHLNMFVRDMVAGRGFIALSIDILGRYTPGGILVGSLFFGIVDALQLVIQSDKVPGQLLQMLPYLVTLLAVVLAVKDVRPPASMGKIIEERE